MTIAIGLMCRDGVVLGADREVSLETLQFQDEKKAYLLKRQNVSIGLVGAGSLDLISRVADDLNKRLADNMSHEAVKVAVEQVAEEIHEKYVLGFPAANHTLNILVGVKTTPSEDQRRVGLLKVQGNLVVWKNKYEAFGWASELARYLLHVLYGTTDKVSVLRGTMLATWVLKQLKARGQFAGGSSDIIQVRLGYQADFVHEDDIHLHEESADKFARIIQPVLFAMTDVNVTNDALDQLIERMMSELHTFRPNAFMERQRISPSSQERAAVMHDDLTSVFGDVETSAAPFYDPNLDRDD